MSGQSRISVAAIFGGIGDLAVRHARIWVVATLFMAVVLTALDMALAGETEVVATFIGSIANFFISYHVTEAIMRQEALQATSRRSYASLFGASILTSLGIGLGFIVLLVPGLYLMARWSMVTPLIVGEGRRTTEALSESWARTKDSVGPLMVVYVVYFIGVIALIAFAATAGAIDAGPSDAGAGTANSGGPLGLIMPLVVNLASVTIGMIGTLIGIAVYRALAGGGGAYDDVFS